MTTRRHFLSLLGVSGVACSLPDMVYSREGRGASTRPNIVIVFPDQMRAHAMGFMKEDKVFTPHLDAFAKESHTFTQAVSTYPVCSPFRSMLMAGQYPLQSGVVTNCITLEKKGPVCSLSKDAVCWSDVLAKSGYDQYYIGKWHLDAPHKPWIPTYNNNGSTKWNEWCSPDARHGFNHWYAYGTYDYHLKPMYWDTDAPRDGFKFVTEWGPTHEVNRAVGFIKNTRDKDKPFTVVISMNPPHTGYNLVPKKYVDVYKDVKVEDLVVRDNVFATDRPMGRHFRKNIKYYQACVTGVDEQFGRLLKTLKEEGLEENTIVFFFSDHGDCMGSNGCITKNNPHEESIRIPMMIRWPKAIKATFDEALIEVVDLAPTILGLTGQAIPKSMVGRNLAPYLLGEAGTTLSNEWQLYMLTQPTVEIAIPAYQLEQVSLDLGKPAHYGMRGIRNKRYTCVFTYLKPNSTVGVHYFDREKDRFERTNLASESMTHIAQLRKTLKGRLEEIGDPFATIL